MPPPEAQLSVVHANLSSQDGASQQVLSTQLPFWQATPVLQAAPLGNFWQVPEGVPAIQLFPPVGLELEGVRELQSALLLAQAVLHLPASHW